jgi:hypothetical protein
VPQVAQNAPPTWRKYTWPALGAVVIALLCWLSIKWYFVEFTSLRTYGNYTAVTADALVRYAQDKFTVADYPSYRMVFFGAPQMYIDFGSIEYLVPEIASQDIPDPLTGPFDPVVLPPDGKRPLFIFMPFRFNELDFVRQTYPNGQVEELPSPVPGASEPLLYIYRIDG